MKKFVNSASYFAKHGANIVFRLFMALLLISAAASVAPSLLAIVPYAVAFVIALYVFTHSFNGERAKVAGLTTQADIFNMSQLQLKDIVLQSIRQHFGDREIPELLDKRLINRKDIYHIKYLTPGESVFKFFDKVPGSFFSNSKEINQSSNKMAVFFGITAELATGAAAADTPDILDFKTPVAGTDEEVLNGEFSFKANTKIRVENSLYKTSFVNDDAIKNFYRFPSPIVWEPSNSMEFELRLCKSYGAAVHKFERVTLVGYELVTE